MSRCVLGILGSFLITAAGCTQSGYCADVFPNATVTDVLLDDAAGQLHVALQHSLSYCTGTDEKRYSLEHITIDLASGAVAFDQRASNSLDPYALPETCCYLYRDGGFGNADCPGCELVLRSRDEQYTAHFVTSGIDALDPVMTLEVTRAGAPIAVIDIDGYMSQVR